MGIFEQPAMHPRFSHISLLLVLLFILGFLSPAIVEGFSNNGVSAAPMYSLDKDNNGVGKGMMKMNKIRKLIVVVPEVVLDYEDPGPNRRHDPRAKKPGNGGDRNP